MFGWACVFVQIPSHSSEPISCYFSNFCLLRDFIQGPRRNEWTLTWCTDRLALCLPSDAEHRKRWLTLYEKPHSRLYASSYFQLFWCSYVCSRCYGLPGSGSHEITWPRLLVYITSKWNLLLLTCALCVFPHFDVSESDGTLIWCGEFFSVGSHKNDHQG